MICGGICKSYRTKGTWIIVMIVTYNGKPIKINKADVFPAPYHCIKKYPFVIIDGLERGELCIELEFAPEKLVLRPLSMGIKPVIDGKKVTINIEKPCNISLEADDFYMGIFAYGESKVDVQSYDHIIHFEEGVHEAGTIDIENDNTAVFIDEGAFVHGKIVAKDRKNIAVFGNGIISMQRYEKTPIKKYGYLDIYEQQKKLINEIAWDGNWFIRCITDNGTYIGSEKEPQAKIWLNSQSWSVISKMGDADKQRKAMDNVNKYLDTDLGVKKIHPSMTTDYPSKDGNLTMYNKGCGENGSVFCHANTWAIIAECMLGNADRAYKYYHQLLPMIAQAKAGEWRYKAEPYVYASNIFGPESDKFGLANVSWLTGTAAWMYIAVTQHMLGIKAKWNGLEINPCLSKEMLPAKVTRVFRGCKYDITITKNEKMFIEHVDGRKEYKI